MGGRVAEELVFGDITSGAQQDISHATDIAHAMVCAFGMSEKLGPVKYDERSEHIYLGRDITRNESCSEATRQEIDKEVSRIIREGHDRAVQILTEKRELLDKLALALLEKETMSADEIRTLLDLPEFQDAPRHVPRNVAVETPDAADNAETSQPAAGQE